VFAIFIPLQLIDEVQNLASFELLHLPHIGRRHSVGSSQSTSPGDLHVGIIEQDASYAPNPSIFAVEYCSLGMCRLVPRSGAVLMSVLASLLHRQGKLPIVSDLYELDLDLVANTVPSIMGRLEPALFSGLPDLVEMNKAFHICASTSLDAGEPDEESEILDTDNLAAVSLALDCLLSHRFLSAVALSSA